LEVNRAGHTQNYMSRKDNFIHFSPTKNSKRSNKSRKRVEFGSTSKLPQASSRTSGLGDLDLHDLKKDSMENVDLGPGLINKSKSR